MARKGRPAPDIDYLGALRTEKEVEFQRDDEQIDRMREVRTLTRPVALGDQYRFTDVEVRDPTVADLVQRVVATLALNPPKLQVTPVRPGDTAEANANLRQQWTEQVLKVAGQRLPGQDTFAAIVDAAVGDGGAWCKLLFKGDLWEERYGLKFKPDEYADEEAQREAARAYDRKTEDAKKAAGPPFAWVPVDARTVYPVWGPSGQLEEVLEVTTRPVHATLRQYRLGFNRKGELVPEEVGQPLSRIEADKGRTLPHEVKFLEHWDDTWCTYAIEAGDAPGLRRIVKQFRHRYGRVPYFYAPGYTFNFQRGRKVGWSVAEGLRWLVEYRSYLETIYAQVAARDAVPPLFRELPEGSPPLYGDDAHPNSVERYELREIIQGRPGEKLIPLQFPGVGPALKEHLQQVNERISSLLPPRVTSDIGSGLEGAGFAINQVLSEARIQLDPISQHIEQMLEETTRFLWELVRNTVRETVYVRSDAGKDGWLSAAPEDLTDNVGLDWSLDPERPSAKLIEERYWGERLQQGTASLDQAIKAMGDDPEEVYIGRAVDRIRNGQWYTAMFDKAVAQQAGRGDLVAAAQQAQSAAQQMGQAQPPQAPGGMGNGVVPDMGNLAMHPGGGGAAGPQPVPMQSIGGAVPPMSQQPNNASGMVGT